MSDSGGMGFKGAAVFFLGILGISHVSYYLMKKREKDKSNSSEKEK